MDLIIYNHIIDAPIMDILKRIKMDKPDILKNIEEKGDDIRVTCPVHKGGKEAHPSCGILNKRNNPDYAYGSVNCFTCGFKGPLWRFVAECYDCDDESAKQWLVDNFSSTIASRTIDLPEMELFNKKKTAVETIDESTLDKMQSFHPYMRERKLTQKVCDTFKIKYDPQTKCLVFPVWDDRDNLVMFTRRSVESKNFIIDEGKEKPIYLYNFIKKHSISEITVCESQINALTLWGYGIPAVATFGCNLTPKQLEIFNQSFVRHYYLAFDGDDAGIKGTRKFIKNIRNDVLVDVIILPEGKDVNDLTEEEFDNLRIITKDEWLKEHPEVRNGRN